MPKDEDGLVRLGIRISREAYDLLAAEQAALIPKRVGYTPYGSIINDALISHLGSNGNGAARKPAVKKKPARAIGLAKAG
jgi:hypothetical protein